MHEPVIILVAPQMGENIGATARAMKNFTLSKLRIVQPRDGWPNSKAESMSAGAIDIIKAAQIYDDLKSAIADLDYLYATTAAPRDMNINYVKSVDLSLDVMQQFGRQIGIMFGRENNGLSNDEISLANKIITIDTNFNFSSLNIAQAVIIVCYELFKVEQNIRNDLGNEQELCNKDELDFFLTRLYVELDSKNFFRDQYHQKYMQRNIRNLFNRIDNLTIQEIQTLHGVISSFKNSKGC